MFDYLDDIIALESTSKLTIGLCSTDVKKRIVINEFDLFRWCVVFNAITTFHVNSMTPAGQCRLSPLIPLIQDSNQLYDFLVRIMFKLHSNLPNDVLAGKMNCFISFYTLFWLLFTLRLTIDFIIFFSDARGQDIAIDFVRFSRSSNHSTINRVIFNIL